MPKIKELPPGFRAPGSFLVVLRTVGLRTISENKSAQFVETTCLKPREDKGGEPCGNPREIQAKQVTGARRIKSCLDCATGAKQKGREPEQPVETQPGLRGEVLGITEKTYRAIRAELRAEGGARWKEFQHYKRTRVRMSVLKIEGLRPYRKAWTLAAQIEALQVAICSPPSGRCCYRHEFGDVDDPPEEGTTDELAADDSLYD